MCANKRRANCPVCFLYLHNSVKGCELWLSFKSLTRKNRVFSKKNLEEFEFAISLHPHLRPELGFKSNKVPSSSG